MQTLMDSEEPRKRGRKWKVFLASVGALGVIGTGIAANYFNNMHERMLRSDTLEQMSGPFRTQEITEQITGTHAVLQESGDFIYFTARKDQFDTSADIQKLTKNPEAVQFAGPDGILGDKVFDYEGYYFFRFPPSDFKVDKARQITVDFGDIDYTITLGELSDFLRDKTICGSRRTLTIGRSARGELLLDANHGYNLAVKGEPSLYRFAEQLVNGATTNEEKAQRLLDFVTRKIKYDGKDTIRKTETMKRPDEVLVTREADCAGKSILYASLLEQLGIKYFLVYFNPKVGDGHLAVAVEGNFPNYNGLKIEIGGRNYSIAETTLKSGFYIGRTFIANKDIYSGERFVQGSCPEKGFLDSWLPNFGGDSNVRSLDTGTFRKLGPY